MRSIGPSVPHNARPVVFVVDDDESIRESLRALIETQGWDAEVFASAQEFLSHRCFLAPCCLVLDVSLPGLNGLDLQQRITAERADMPIIFITGHGDVPTTVRAMKAGAIEFLIKPLSAETLLKAIRSAIERSVATLRQRSQTEVIRNSYDSLTPRERDVMAMVVRGYLNKQIASELAISEITVKTHRGRVMRKMKAKSVPGLVSIAARLGLDVTRNR